MAGARPRTVSVATAAVKGMAKAMAKAMPFIWLASLLLLSPTERDK
jgi:hypothetical protein